MRGLEAVDLRDSAGDDDAHGVGHIVFVQRDGDGLVDHRAAQAHHIGIGAAVNGAFRLIFLCHRSNVLSYIGGNSLV